jgi:hypothetical protein
MMSLRRLKSVDDCIKLLLYLEAKILGDLYQQIKAKYEWNSTRLQSAL